MRRVSGTALFIFLSSAPLITATMIMLCTSAALFIVGGVQAIYLIERTSLIPLVIGGVVASTCSIAAGYMLLTYHRHGIKVAKIYFVLCALFSGVEIFRPSLPDTIPMADGATIVFPAMVTHLYMAFMAACVGLYIWLFKLYSQPGFVATYQAVSKNIGLIFDYMSGRPIPHMTQPAEPSRQTPTNTPQESILMLDLYLSTWRKAFTWQGRASRKEYWLFMLVAVAAAMLFLGVTIYLKTMAFFWVYAVWIAICLIPSLSVAIRRLHDINLSGWWIAVIFALSSGMEIARAAPSVDRWLVAFFSVDMWIVSTTVAVIINIAWLAAMLWKGTKGDNRFGPPPAGKAPEAPSPEA